MHHVRAAANRLRSMTDPELDALCRAHDVRVLTLFGSAATDEPSPGDLDLGVVFEPESPHDLLGLLEALSDLLGIEEIEVVDATRASETARHRAIAAATPLYESEAGAYAHAAMAAEALYLETERLRRAAVSALQT